MKRRILLGLTGTFGSGKSTAAKILKSKGAKVIDCDKLAHEVFDRRKAPAVHKKLQKLFGVKLERPEIAKIVFQNRLMRRKLEAIVHPYVKKRIFDHLARIKRGVVVIEVPLLFESGFDQWMDFTATVSAPESAMLRRLKKRGIPEAAVKARWKSQLPLKEKEKSSDFIINNSGSLKELKKQVVNCWGTVLKGTGL